MFVLSSPEQKVSAALETARHAVELDPRDPAAHVALGWAFNVTGDARNGLDSTRRAVDLNPSMPEAWFWFGWAQLLTGDPEACIASNERARRLNPQGPMAFLADDNLGWGYWETGRFEAGLEAGHRLVAARPTYWPGYMHVAINAVELGRIDEARAAIAAGRRVEPNFSLALVRRSIGVSRPGIDARWNAALHQAGLD